MKNIDISELIGLLNEVKQNVSDREKVSDFSNGKLAMAQQLIDYLKVLGEE